MRLIRMIALIKKSAKIKDKKILICKIKQRLIMNVQKNKIFAALN
jgi:hypothetical protein